MIEASSEQIIEKYRKYVEDYYKGLSQQGAEQRHAPEPRRAGSTLSVNNFFENATCQPENFLSAADAGHRRHIIALGLIALLRRPLAG